MQRVACLGYTRLCPASRLIYVPQRGQSQITAASQSAPPTRLVLYSKAECHLCHGLKDKISGVLAKAQYMQSPLTDAELEVRDITVNEEWEKDYGMVIPVLTVIPSGTSKEIKVKRVPPRSSADKLSQHILEAMELSKLAS